MTPPELKPAIDAPVQLLALAAGQVAIYQSGCDIAELPPLLLVHSVNAAASAAEVQPLFDHARLHRTVWAMDLPGFGLSDRPDVAYSPQMMTDAVSAVLAELCARAGVAQVDLLAVSLGCEFAARAAQATPLRIRRLAMVSPTGFSAKRRPHGPPGTTRVIPWLDRWLRSSAWGDRIFRQLTRPGVIRYFLRRTFGSPAIDDALWRYAVATTRQPGARHAPLRFVSGALFSADVTDLYNRLHMPVWVSMPTRGDFTDYDGRSAFESRSHWRFQRMEGGALPYFEDSQAFHALLDPFWH